MYITFINDKIKKFCEDNKLARRKLGDRCAKLLFQRIAEIRASDNLSTLHLLPGPRCHSLSSNRNGQYAVDLEHPKRLVFLPIFDGELIEKLVTDVVIIEIIDYH